MKFKRSGASAHLEDYRETPGKRIGDKDTSSEYIQRSRGTGLRDTLNNRRETSLDTNNTNDYHLITQVRRRPPTKRVQKEEPFHAPADRQSCGKRVFPNHRIEPAPMGAGDARIRAYLTGCAG